MAGEQRTTVPVRTLRIVRTFDAPRDLVFRCWTEPEHLVRWMSAKDWMTPSARTDLRRGGEFHIQMAPADRSHEGFDMYGTYEELRAPERIVMRLGDGRLMTATFADRAGRTELTFTVEMAMSEEQERLGYTQILDKLEAHLAAGVR
ncbi:MAG TPA: SRPBCC domain-containing protein [Candidatus Limnocylindria bacterium]|nr:SRPBCC domain-containing protein [Candidatus Limnocylindria bacterium]